MAEFEAGNSTDHRQAFFDDEWRIYRKVVENNYLFHEEAYDRLRRFLLHEAVRPFRFLDIACGDASASVNAIKETPIATYRGIDLSEAALDLARENLANLDCPVSLEKGNFVEVLRENPEQADVIWIGLSLHHLLTPAKLAFMRAMRLLLGSRGMFLIYENTSPNGEDRDTWLGRWDAHRALWSAYTQEEWQSITDHVHASDHPETDATWRRLGHEAGFHEVRELYATPDDMFRLYSFAA